MSLDQPHVFLASVIAALTLLVAVWAQIGLGAALVFAATADLTITLYRRRRLRDAATVRVRSERG